MLDNIFKLWTKNKESVNIVELWMGICRFGKINKKAEKEHPCEILRD